MCYLKHSVDKIGTMNSCFENEKLETRISKICCGKNTVLEFSNHGSYKSRNLLIFEKKNELKFNSIKIQNIESI